MNFFKNKVRIFSIMVGILMSCLVLYFADSLFSTFLGEDVIVIALLIGVCAYFLTRYVIRCRESTLP